MPRRTRSATSALRNATSSGAPPCCWNTSTNCADSFPGGRWFHRFARPSGKTATNPACGPSRPRSDWASRPPLLPAPPTPVRHDKGRPRSCHGRPFKDECTGLPVDDELHRLCRDTGNNRQYGEDGKGESLSEAIHGALLPEWGGG